MLEAGISQDSQAGGDARLQSGPQHHIRCEDVFAPLMDPAGRGEPHPEEKIPLK